MYAKTSAGVGQAPLIDSDRRLVIASGGGKYTKETMDGNVYVVANQAAVAVTAALETTYTGLVVGNAATTGKNFIMLGFGYSSTVAIPTATSIGIMAGSMTALASTMTPINRKLGGASSVAWCEDSCTIGTPILHQAFSQAWAEATTAGSIGPNTWIDLDGSLIVTPGTFVAAYSTAALSASMLLSFMWMEVDV